MAVRILITWMVAGGLTLASPAAAKWRAADGDVAAAAGDERIAGALAAVDRIDQALIDDDHATFAALLDDDLAVNNPQNGVSVRGATGRRGAAGRIRYSRYDRVIEYAGRRGDLVLLMGEEIVIPKTQDGLAAAETHRRFTDLWRNTGGGWKLTARQATVISRP